MERNWVFNKKNVSSSADLKREFPVNLKNFIAEGYSAVHSNSSWSLKIIFYFFLLDNTVDQKEGMNGGKIT